MTHSRSSLPPCPPAPTVQEPTEAADTRVCGGQGKTCQEMHWYSCSLILKIFLRNHLWGGKRPHTKLKRSSLGHIHNICLKPSLVKKDPTSPEGLCHHGQAALGAFSLTAGCITAPMGTTTVPLILGPLGIMWSVGGHLNHEQICSGGGKKTAAQRSYAHGL